MTQNIPFSESVRAIFLRAEEMRKLSVRDRQKLMLALTSENITEEEHHLVNLLLYSVRVGRLSVD